MQTRILIRILVLLFLVLSAACQGQDAAPISEVTETPAPTTMAEETETPEPTRLAEVPDPAGAPAILSVPGGEPPTIDGTLSPGEWDGAAMDSFADGSELFLMYADGYLYLGIRSVTPEMIAGNVFVDGGEEIRILHASAALGTALYAPGVGGWAQAQAFTWRCRQTGNGEAARAERDAFLGEEDWVAANSRTGTPAELEYQIAVTEETIRLAANILRSSDPEAKTPWPADLDDDCIAPTPGGLPDELHFSPDRWATISLAPGGEG
jgi:hypothetical protein